MNHILKLLCFLLLTMLVADCKNGDEKIADKKVPNFVPLPGASESSTDRNSWQKPRLVIDYLGDVSDKVIADIGAGTGYFTFRMAFVAKKVIALEIDTNMIAIIESFRENLPSEIQSKIESRLVTPNDALLKKDEADIAVLINTLSYIDKPEQYLKKLRRVLRGGGKIMVVDFKENKFPIGAARPDRTISIDEVVKALQACGYKSINADSNALDYQYIVVAEDL